MRQILESLGKFLIPAFILVSPMWLLADDLPINDQLDKVETSLKSLEDRAEVSMSQIAEDQPHLKIAAFSSDMSNQAQQLKAIKNFDLVSKSINDQKQRLAENKRLSETTRIAAGASLAKSTKRLDELRDRADILQKRLEELEKAADQWAADFAQMRSIDEKEAMIQLRKSIESELRIHAAKGNKKKG
jgi:hypothetical protein